MVSAAPSQHLGFAPALRVGCVPDLPVHRLQAFLGAMYAGDSGVRTDVARLRTHEQLRRLRTGELDLGLVHAVGDEAGIGTQPVFAGERVAALLPVGHRLAGRPTLGPEELRDQTLLVVPCAADPALAARVAALLATAGFRFREVRETHGADDRDVAFAVAEGHGIAVAPASAVRALGDIAALVTAHPLDPPVRMPDTVLAWRSDAPREPALVATARRVARALRTG